MVQSVQGSEEVEIGDFKCEYEKIWSVLSKIDVSEHTEKKGNFTYLSWAWAWEVLMKYFPHAEYDVHPTTFYSTAGGSNTAEVSVTLRIGYCQRMMWLPVMDYSNKAKENPTARDISDARMRCLVKTIAMFGLGHYLYAGEDLPRETEVEEIKLEPKMQELEEGHIGWIKEELSGMDTVEELKRYWGANHVEFNKLSSDRYKTIQDLFKNRKEELGEE